VLLLAAVGYTKCVWYFTSNILGYILQIKEGLRVFIHRNDIDKKFVTAYQNTLSVLDMHSKIIEDFVVFRSVQ
jgi:hypothetical protein